MNLPKTNNDLEANHNRLQGLVGRPHIGLYDLVLILGRESIVIEKKILDHCMGKHDKLKKELVKTSKRLSAVLESKEQYEPYDFIEALARNLKLK